jgi:DNA-binding MarR family transcriptional regulator
MSMLAEQVESPCVCATLRMTTRAVARLYDQELAPHGLRTTQYSILARLEVEGPMSIGHLAARLAMDRTTLSREAAPLVRAGLVEQNAGEDRRRRVLGLSSEGRIRIEAARPAWREAQRRVRAELGYDRVEGLLGELRALLGAVRA